MRQEEAHRRGFEAVPHPGLSETTHHGPAEPGVVSTSGSLSFVYRDMIYRFVDYRDSRVTGVGSGDLSGVGD